MADSSEVKVNLGNKWHLLLASGPTVGDDLGFHDSKIPSAEKVDLQSTVEVAAGLDSKLFIQVSFVFCILVMELSEQPDTERNLTFY